MNGTWSELPPPGTEIQLRNTQIYNWENTEMQLRNTQKCNWEIHRNTIEKYTEIQLRKTQNYNWVFWGGKKYEWDLKWVGTNRHRNTIEKYDREIHRNTIEKYTEIQSIRKYRNTIEFSNWRSKAWMGLKVGWHHRHRKLGWVCLLSY